MSQLHILVKFTTSCLFNLTIEKLFKELIMKKFWFVLFLIFSLALFSQSYVPQKPPLLFSLNNNDLRTVLTSKSSLVKMSDKEIVEITKIINERKEEYLTLNEKARKSVPIDANGKPTGKADTELLRAREAVGSEVASSIYEILGEKRYIQFDRTLINESARRNSEGLKIALKNKNK